MADYGDVSGGDSDAAVRAIVAQLTGAPAAANPSDPTAPVSVPSAPEAAPLPRADDNTFFASPADDSIIRAKRVLGAGLQSPLDVAVGKIFAQSQDDDIRGTRYSPEMGGIVAPVAAAAPMASTPAPGVTPAMSWQPQQPSPALMGALVAPRPAKPTMGTVYNPQPMTTNTQGLAAIANGISAGLDGRDDLKKQDALQDAIQDATEGD